MEVKLCFCVLDCDSNMVCYTDKCHQCYFHGTQKTVGVCRKESVSVEKCPTSGHMVCQDRVTCALKCNNITECEDGEDESGCPGCPVEKCPTSEHIVCQDRVTCALKCNNITECEDGEDEKGCPGCPVPVDSKCCPDFWITFSGSCYLFVSSRSLSFYDAESLCSSRNGHLVHVDNVAELVFIGSYLRSINAGETWLGLTDEGTEGLWQWYGTNTTPSVTDWYPEEPTNVSGDEDCMVVKPTPHYQWFAFRCSGKKAPLCEQTLV